MAVRPSAAMQRFVASVTAPLTRASLEEYDLGALAAVEPEERGEVEELLAARLAAGDGRAASACAELATPRARQILKDALTLPVARAVCVAAARALGQLGDAAGEAPLVDALAHGDAFERRMVANALRFYRDPTAESALLAATVLQSDTHSGSNGSSAFCDEWIEPLDVVARTAARHHRRADSRQLVDDRSRWSAVTSSSVSKLRALRFEPVVRALLGWSGAGRTAAVRRARGRRRRRRASRRPAPCAATSAPPRCRRADG